MSPTRKTRHARRLLLGAALLAGGFGFGPVGGNLGNFTYPATSQHYATAGNWDTGSAQPVANLGFTIIDVSSAGDMPYLPSGTKALIYIGTCNGADTTFTTTVSAYTSYASQIFGWYLMDEPDPTGTYSTQCTPANLKAESDYLHTHFSGTKTFIVLLNLGTPTAPAYSIQGDPYYTTANTDIDYFGMDPYPCRNDPGELIGCDYSIIPLSVATVEGSPTSIPAADLIPVYQAFGGGGYPTYVLPTLAQELQILAAWKGVLPSPAWDYVYAYGSQTGDVAMENTPYLRSLFLVKNQGQ